MATRPIFISKTDGDFLVKTQNIDFEWFPGLSVSQKQKSIDSLHLEAKKLEGVEKVLET